MESWRVREQERGKLVREREGERIELRDRKRAGIRKRGGW